MFFRELKKEEDWYEKKLLPIVQNDLNHFLEQKNIDYKTVIEVFKNHMNHIITRHQTLKETVGVLPDYRIAIDLGLQISIWDLIIAGKNYLKQKVFQGVKRAQFTGKVKEVIDIAKQHAPPEEDGHKRLLQVNCIAERDFMRLVLHYVNFFITEKVYHNGYSVKIIDIALKFPPVHTVIGKKVLTAKKLIQKFDDQLSVSIAETNQVHP